jgi:hypothetical protein
MLAGSKPSVELAKGKGGKLEPKPALEWPTEPRDLLVKFLTERVSDAPDAPNRELSFITEAGVARFTRTAWRAWLVEQGIAVGKVEAGRPLRELGFVMRAFSLPGEGRALGMYLGDAPKGTEKLPAQGGAQGRRWRPAQALRQAEPRSRWPCSWTRSWPRPRATSATSSWRSCPPRPPDTSQHLAGNAEAAAVRVAAASSVAPPSSPRASAGQGPQPRARLGGRTSKNRSRSAHARRLQSSHG